MERQAGGAGRRIPRAPDVRENPGNRIGRLREEKVADIVGGKATGGVKVKTDKGSTGIDVTGPLGEIIGVGGVGKNMLPEKLNKEINFLLEIGRKREVPVKYFLEEGTNPLIIKQITNLLGENNVFIFLKLLP